MAPHGKELSLYLGKSTISQPRTQALYSTLLPCLRKDPGSGWSRVSQILGDYKKNSQGWVAKFILPINLSK